jgi:hypothetical protein
MIFAVAADLPVFHPIDEDLSLGAPVLSQGPAPKKTVKMFIT